MIHPTRREVLALGGGLLLSAARPWFARAATTDPELVRYANERTYEIRHGVEVDMGGVPLESLEIWLPVPGDWPEQTVGELTIRPKAPVVRDKTGMAKVATLFVKNREPVPSRRFSLELSYRLTCREIVPDRAALARYRLRDYEKDVAYRLFTRPEKKIETGDPAIAAVAEKLRGESRPPLEIARAVYDWVLEHTEYRLIPGFGGAGYCLTNAHGECGDYSALFVALCRAAGVPARPVNGFWADKKDGWHCWAEFMLPSGEWLPVDCSLGDQGWFRREHYFGAIDNRRVALCKTNDVELAGRRGNQRRADFLQTGLWWWRGGKPDGDAPAPKAEFSAVGRPVEGV
jgi:transglutaminase-like putative cysteine protease